MQRREDLATNKEFLRSIADNDYEIPAGIDHFTFAKALLENLASVDSELRDELSYMILASGIIDRQKLTIPQLEKLLESTLDENHLFYRIGEAGADSVFMRSFSNLIVAAILYTDTRNPQLPEDAVHKVKIALFDYARREKDWRGYVSGKGWGHAMAHLADALDQLAQHPAASQAEREEVMMLVSELAKMPVPLYNEEDVRLATIAYHIILGKQVAEEFLESWLQACFVARDADVASWTSATNSKNFLRSLYFLLLWDNMALVLVEKISDLLRRQDAVYLEKGGEQ
ncbi:MAG: DUF2785 domain-containing protein [Ktedonobacteraceae bacterium]|nr:DUF2785 domain-containing protein [Ktedonobacteraceae bacterium]